MSTPAFPSPGVVINKRSHEEQQGAYEGMTLRDYFAAKALSGLLAGLLADGSNIKANAEDEVCELAFSYANKMLKARAS